jgi:hypothetical protein
MACSRCGTCNSHWNNGEWKNNGENERRGAGYGVIVSGWIDGRFCPDQPDTCGSPGCVMAPPIEYRAHTWGSIWHKDEARHRQECITCPDSDKAHILENEHFFGNWFFHIQTEAICQIRFEYCVCGQYNPDNTRPHEFDEDGNCITIGCAVIRTTPIDPMMIMMADAMYRFDEIEYDVFDDINTAYRMPEEPMQDILARLDKVISRMQAGCGITGLDVLDFMALEYALENNMIDFDLLEEKILVDLQQVILDGLILSESSVRDLICELLANALKAFVDEYEDKIEETGLSEIITPKKK